MSSILWAHLNLLQQASSLLARSAETKLGKHTHTVVSRQAIILISNAIRPRTWPDCHLFIQSRTHARAHPHTHARTQRNARVCTAAGGWSQHQVCPQPPGTRFCRQRDGRHQTRQLWLEISAVPSSSCTIPTAPSLACSGIYITVISTLFAKHRWEE